MSTALAAYGAQLKRGDGGGSEIFTTIAEVTKITCPPLKQDTADVSAEPATGPFTVTAASTTMAITASYIVPVGTHLQFTTTGTLPSGLALLTTYYVLSRGAATVTVSATSGGAAITFADVGSGTHTFTERRHWRQFIPTLRDGGEVTLDLSFIPTNAQQGYGSGLILDLTAKTVRNFQLVFNDGIPTTWPFAAMVTGFKATAMVAGVLTATATLRLTGQPTLA